MTSAEFLSPNFFMFSLSEANFASSLTVFSAVFNNVSGAYMSFTYSAASLFTNAKAFFV